jgi:hypothetical protein
VMMPKPVMVPELAATFVGMGVLLACAVTA